MADNTGDMPNDDELENMMDRFFTVQRFHEDYPEDNPFVGSKLQSKEFLKRYDEFYDENYDGEVENLMLEALENYVINDLFAEYSVVEDQGNVNIAKVEEEAKTITFYRSAGDLKLLFRNKKIYVPEEDRKGKVTFKIKSAWDFFMDSGMRPTYRKVVFKPFPATAEGEEQRRKWEEDNCDEHGRLTVMNTFRGLPLEPLPEDTYPYEEVTKHCDLIISHIHDVICSGDTPTYLWLMNFFANKVQRFNHYKVAFNVTGDAGSGKSVIFNQLMQNIFGNDICFRFFNSYEPLVARFSPLRANDLYITIDDSPIMSRSESTQFKSLLSEQNATIEEKMGAHKKVENNSTFVFISNNQNRGIFAMDADDRRMMSLNAKKWSRSKEDLVPYFNKLVEQINGNDKFGSRAFYTLLLRFNIDDCEKTLKELKRGVNGSEGDYAPHLAPKTSQTFTQKLGSMSLIEQFFYESLVQKSFGVIEKPTERPDGIRRQATLELDNDDFVRIPRIALWNAYANWCSAVGKTRPQGLPNDFWTLLKSIFPEAIRHNDNTIRISMTSEKMQGKWGRVCGSESKATTVDVGEIEDLRLDFETYFDAIGAIDWENEQHEMTNISQEYIEQAKVITTEIDTEFFGGQSLLALAEVNNDKEVIIIKDDDNEYEILDDDSDPGDPVDPGEIKYHTPDDARIQQKKMLREQIDHLMNKETPLTRDEKKILQQFEHKLNVEYKNVPDEPKSDDWDSGDIPF